MFEEKQIENEMLPISFKNGITVYIKREDKLHPYISGNKYRKLKYNFIEAKKLGYSTILTFGGAYSNHIAAAAAAGKEYGVGTIGVIRGDELVDKYLENPTLKKAFEDGMKFKFVTRTQYRQKTEDDFLEKLRGEFEEFYLVPEGGTNSLAVKGCEEILKDEDEQFDYICSAVGTGGTLSGLINSSREGQKVLGFPALKGDFLYKDIRKFVSKDNWDLILEYHFGGYAKKTPELINFLEEFYNDTSVLLDPIYTGKMMFGIFDLIEKDYFPKGSKILAIHTGGLQGWNNTFKSKLAKI